LPAPDAETADAWAQRLYRHYAALDHAGSALYPDVAETLAALKAAGYRLAVCTNKPEAPARELLARLGIGGLFGAVAGGDSFPARKPDPAHVLGVLEQLGAQPDHAVMVGDGINDVLAARRAGVRSILVAYGYSAERARTERPDVEVAAFGEIGPALEAMLADA
jgi:phosphoglycolate phosphatase